LPHAIAVTKAEVTDRKGVLLAFARCKAVLRQINSILVDSVCTGRPFAQGRSDILGQQVTAQIAKRSELHIFKVMLKPWIAEHSSPGWRKIED